MGKFYFSVKGQRDGLFKAQYFKLYSALKLVNKSLNINDYSNNLLWM